MLGKQSFRFSLLAAGSAAIAFSAIAFAPNGPAKAEARSRGGSNLSGLCNAQAMQAVADRLSTKVIVGKIANLTGPAFADGTQYVAASGDLPAFCQVTGSYVTNAATGKTANFLATFPETWNGKYLQLGCAGHCGTFAVSNPATVTITITNQGTPGQIIRKGYAAFATDQGHTEMTGGSWAIKGPGQVSEDAITDYLYRASQVLSQMGKEFTQAFYAQETGVARPIARSYFSGCSGGGRDAMVAASYFPEEFDGIVAGSPYNLMGRAFHAVGTSIATLRSPDAGLSPALLKLFDEKVVTQCDGLDGVKDGLIQNPMACNFRPERDLPKCEGDQPGGQCFTKAQIETMSTVLTAVTDEHGNLVQPGYSVSDMLDAFAPPPPQDSAAADPWPDTLGGTGGMWALGNAAIKVFSHQNDPAFQTRSILTYRSGGPGRITDFRTVVPKVEVDRAMAVGRRGIGHFPENADKLIRQNRKLLIWHNLSDEKLTPYMSVNYYKQLAARHGGYGKLQRNVRLFGLPGTAHCSGGGFPVGPGSFDALSAIENWVEKDQAPDALIASLYQPTSYGGVDFSKPLGRTMPLCKFPEMARYVGSGDVKDAKNWRCSPGDKRMLVMGESGRRAGVIE